MNSTPTLDDLAAELVAPLVIIVPSRGRPGNILELVTAWDETAAGGYADLVVAVDHDDPTLDDYLELLEPDGLPAFVTVVVGDRLRLGGTLNQLAPAFAVDRRGVGFLGDDHRPRSTSWDRRIAEELEAEPFGVVYGNDLVRGRELPTAVVLGGPIIVELGYMVPRGAVHLYLDDYWLRLGRDLATINYLDDVVIEHRHPIAGTAPMDAGYAEVNAPEVYAADELTFRTYLEQHHDDAIAALEVARAKYRTEEATA